MATNTNDRRIAYVEFNVADIERSKEFYGGAFGWSFKDYGPQYCEFSDGRLTGGGEPKLRRVPPGIAAARRAAAALPSNRPADPGVPSEGDGSVLDQQAIDFYRSNGYYLNRDQLFSPERLDENPAALLFVFHSCCVMPPAANR